MQKMLYCLIHRKIKYLNIPTCFIKNNNLTLFLLIISIHDHHTGASFNIVPKDKTVLKPVLVLV